MEVDLTNLQSNTRVRIADSARPGMAWFARVQEIHYGSSEVTGASKITLHMAAPAALEPEREA